ncbi:hypothetical protein ACWPKS_15880 [Coraliomargarita sp. W4R72]
MRTVSAQQIRAVLHAAHPHAIIRPLDTEYAVLTPRAWSALHSEFVFEMRSRGLSEWVEGKGDCDDWAWVFRSWIIERNWQQSASKLPIALAYKQYTTSSGVYHAINGPVVPTSEGGLVATHLEPQPFSGGPFTMSAVEADSCDFIIF